MARFWVTTPTAYRTQKGGNRVPTFMCGFPFFGSPFLLNSGTLCGAFFPPGSLPGRLASVKFLRMSFWFSFRFVFGKLLGVLPFHGSFGERFRDSVPKNGVVGTSLVFTSLPSSFSGPNCFPLFAFKFGPLLSHPTGSAFLVGQPGKGTPPFVFPVFFPCN